LMKLIYPLGTSKKKIHLSKSIFFCLEKSKYRSLVNS